MADAELVTTNALGDGWVDNLPGDAVTGYQAQNTNITARTLGGDLTTVELTGTEVVLKGNSGQIDQLGLPYTLTADKVFLFSSLAEGANWFKLVATANPIERNVELTTIAPTWNPTLNYFESSTGERVLNWCAVKDDGFVSVRRLENHRDMLDTDSLSGIGVGGKRYFTTPGTHTVTIARTGVFSVYCIAGGQIQSGSSGGWGGGCGRADLRLLAGQRVVFVVGELGGDSTVDVSGRLDIDAPVGSGVTPTVVVTGSHFGTAAYPGAKPAYTPTGGFRASGGGSGPFGEGSPGFIDTEIPGTFGDGLDGVSQVGNFGQGATGSGYGHIEWLSE